jgi:hypothetical protein
MITRAAIIQNRIIYSGQSHAEIIKMMVEKYGLPKPIDGIQGFMTDSGEFLDRNTAMEHAIKCGQMPATESGQPLYSEDIRFPRPPLTPLDASVKKLAQDIEDLYMFHGNETPIEEVEKLIAVRDAEIIAMSKKPCYREAKKKEDAKDAGN